MNFKTEEGYIKFTCQFEQRAIAIPENIFSALNLCRNQLKAKNWIGTYPDGIGYGNISMRLPGTDQFYISGSATGDLSILEPQHYALVENCEVEKNSIRCCGLIKASSESMSHYMIYKTIPQAMAVVHIHNFDLWKKYLDVLPTTDKSVTYGTPEMAYEIERILNQPATVLKQIIIMGGHQEGIISYGTTIEEATEAMLKLGKEEF
jgi:ribulose-5-phosphate 4-epimerase/fuculose-1-phosphate aldolase